MPDTDTKPQRCFEVPGQLIARPLAITSCGDMKMVKGRYIEQAGRPSTFFIPKAGHVDPDYDDNIGNLLLRWNFHDRLVSLLKSLAVHDHPRVSSEVLTDAHNVLEDLKNAEALLISGDVKYPPKEAKDG